MEGGNLEVLNSFKEESFKDGEWILGGDFNAIKHSRVRKGKAKLVNHNEEELFADFINKSSLVDIPGKGKKFLKEWKSLKVEGRGDFVLKVKLRLLKDKLRRWNQKVFGKTDLEVEEGVRDLNLADERLKVEEGVRDLNLADERLRWIKDGDSNSGFFHKVMKHRRRLNHIGIILTPGRMVDSVGEVREAVLNHFGNKLIESKEVRPLLDGVPFKSISEADVMDLEKPFLEEVTKEEI
ncbi:uncharacterized protein LOC131637346 [Vicia villosa]|uniref:uncharacterized protein LOC131637346 n=1 Tax=Vicia villosa TaxID=3911 RepID=UPI00273B8908|nr:uncharacterized protein LOC131637346 [Vicia villosa]